MSNKKSVTTEDKIEDKKTYPFVIVETGNEQSILREGNIISLEKLETEDKKTIILDKVLLYGSQNETQIGEPFLNNVKVEAEVLNTAKDKKVIGMKFKRKTGYKKVFGHRQLLTTLKIKSITLKKSTKKEPS
eukprot:COSAG01_NODE_1_length_100484_cov_170.446142_104_plen_132_part_00